MNLWKQHAGLHQKQACSQVAHKVRIFLLAAEMQEQMGRHIHHVFSRLWFCAGPQKHGLRFNIIARKLSTTTTTLILASFHAAKENQITSV